MARLEEEGVGLFTLQTQYRMPPALLKHPSTYFYNGMVSCAQKEEEKKQQRKDEESEIGRGNTKIED